MLALGNIHANWKVVEGGVYEWTFNNKHFVILHGHQFDHRLKQDALRIRFYDWWEKLFRSIDLYIDEQEGERIQLILDNFYGHHYWQEGLDNLSTKAIEFAKKKKCHYIMCGHVHSPAVQFHTPVFEDDEDDGPTYISLGCWIDSDPTLSVVGDNGAELHQYSPRGELIGIVSC